MQQLNGPGSQTGTLSVSVPSAGFYTIGLELDAPSIPAGSPTPVVSATLSGGTHPHRSVQAAIVSSAPKTSNAAADVYLEPGDVISYSVQAVNGADAVAWTARCFLYDQGNEIA